MNGCPKGCVKVWLIRRIEPDAPPPAKHVYHWNPDCPHYTPPRERRDRLVEILAAMGSYYGPHD